MLSIWIGRAGSGKSEKVLRTIAAERTQRAQVLIVPEHTSHRAEVDLCRACGETASRNAEVLSFQNLATRVLSRTGGLADVTLDGGGKLLTMRLALQELSGQLKVFHHPSQRAAFLQQLVELAEEFYAYEIRPEELYEKTQEIGGAMGDKLQSVALLFGAYDAKLHAGGRDARSRVEKLRDALGSSQYLAGKDVYVDGYAYFNRLEEDILSIILRQAHQVTVTLLGEKENQELFQNALRQRERLAFRARSAGLPRRSARRSIGSSAAFSAATRSGRSRRSRSRSMRPPRPTVKRSMSPHRSARWCAAGSTDTEISLSRHGIWIATARFLKTPSAARRSPPIRRGGTTFSKKRLSRSCSARSTR